MAKSAKNNVNTDNVNEVNIVTESTKIVSETPIVIENNNSPTSLFGEIQKGDVSSIPVNLLNRSRGVTSKYNWGNFEVGDHMNFPVEETKQVRGSLNSFITTKKKKGDSIKFATNTMRIKDDKGNINKVFQVWRLPTTE